MIKQEKVHNLCLSDDPKERLHALEEFKNFFSFMPDKLQAWNDLHRLTNDEDSYVRSHVAEALCSAFSQVPDKQQAWSDLLKLTVNEDSGVIYNAPSALCSAFSQVPDKQQALSDLLRLTNDEDSNDEDSGVRYRAVKALGSVFSQVPDKQLAWNGLHRLTSDEDENVRFDTTEALGSAFSQVPDKQQAWNDLHRLTNDEDDFVRSNAAKALGSAFSQVPDKQKAWSDLHRLTNDEDNFVRSSAAEALYSAFSQVPDKQKAWNDLCRLICDMFLQYPSDAKAIGLVFSQVPDKQKAWNDLHRLTNDEDRRVRYRAAEALGSVFSQVPDKQQAWNDLHKLTYDKEWSVRSSAAEALGLAFFQVPDKQQAWNDLHRLTNDENSSVRSSAAEALGLAFFQVPDKQKAWNDLHRLINDEYWTVRRHAAEALGSAFSQVPDKQQAWSDLHRLINDEDSYVRSHAAEALCSAFSQVPNKQKAWSDLHRLTNDEDSSVRAYANHSLGKVFIFMASQAETIDDYKKELENAIEFFEIAAKEAFYLSNPALFCLPFYRSFHTIIFQKQEAREEVGRYLAEAKFVIEGSESKKQLFEAVQNLAEALKEVQNMGNIGLETKKGELNFYRKYCNRAAELMKDSDKKAPFATEVLRKGLPILDRNLKELLEEIQQKAKAVCKQTRGTPAESLGRATNKAAKELLEFEDYQVLAALLDKMIKSYKKFCGHISLEQRPQFLEMVEEAMNMEIPIKGEAIDRISDFVLGNMLNPRIENIYIYNRIEENVRIGTVQLDYTLSEDFPFRIKNEDKEQMKNKILNALRRAKEAEVNVLCFSELCICEEWLPEIRNLCQEMIVISGTYYDKENHNVCRIITSFDVGIPPQLKIFPSDFEDSDITEQRMIPGEKVLNVYESQFGTFAVLICRDFGNFVSNLEGIADIIFCPSYNQANSRFHTIANNHVTNSPSYLVISNTAQYGGTSIFGRMRNSFFGALVQQGCKDKSDTSYKLCEIEKGKEGMIVADFNLIYKSPPLQTPMNPKADIRPVKNIRKIMF